MERSPPPSTYQYPDGIYKQDPQALLPTGKKSSRSKRPVSLTRRLNSPTLSVSCANQLHNLYIFQFLHLQSQPYPHFDYILYHVNKNLKKSRLRQILFIYFIQNSAKSEHWHNLPCSFNREAFWICLLCFPRQGCIVCTGPIRYVGSWVEVMANMLKSTLLYTSFTTGHMGGKLDLRMFKKGLTSWSCSTHLQRW